MLSQAEMAKNSVLPSRPISIMNPIQLIKVNAIQFALEKKSITYIVGDEEDGAVLGYFTITHK